VGGAAAAAIAVAGTVAPTAAAHSPAEIEVDDVPYICAYLKANDWDTTLVAVMAQKRLGVQGRIEDIKPLIQGIEDSGVCS
jgi:3-oxoacyl-ACP reductase-like protein